MKSVLLYTIKFDLVIEKLGKANALVGVVSTTGSRTNATQMHQSFLGWPPHS